MFDPRHASQYMMGNPDRQEGGRVFHKSTSSVHRIMFFGSDPGLAIQRLALLAMLSVPYLATGGLHYYRRVIRRHKG